ncbi:hypothetical protein HAX54_013323 [Datura stramonium]|uniref:non-specific serine/threonine protein kinase n=1 Tax=Datura stramonium TaxID=4076 RepID=A0ABS8RIM6_DATST|nr:hypothetical protein [Datura stramonium]
MLKLLSCKCGVRIKYRQVDPCRASRGVYHRDLKPENLLLDEEGNLKVTDFGLSAFSDHLRQDGLLHTTCGTPAYVAPEVIGKNGYDGATADIWSCGVILYVLLAGFLPFQDQNIMAMYKKIHKGDFKCPPWFSSDAKKLITKMLDPNPSTRITASKIMESSWFKKSMPRTLRTKEEEEFAVGDEDCAGKAKKIEPLNAFHIISLSEGFDLSPLFEEKKKMEKEQLREMRSKSPLSSFILGGGKPQISIAGGRNCHRNCHRKHVEDGKSAQKRISKSRFDFTPNQCFLMGPEEKCAVLYGKYELGRILGQGTFAKVYHARNVVTGENIAMKVVGKEKVIKVGMMEQIKREISVMKMVKHPNIVELAFEVELDPDVISLQTYPGILSHHTTIIDTT